MSYELQQPETEALFAAIEARIGDELPRHKRKQLLAVLNDRAAPPPTRAQLEGLGNTLKALEKQMRASMEQTVALHGACEEEPGKLMKARRERLMFAMTVIKRVEPALIPLTAREFEAQGAFASVADPGPAPTMKQDPDVARVRGIAGGLVDRFMSGEGEHLISDEAITDQQREQVTMALDLLTSIPGSHSGGDVYCDHVRSRACRTIAAYLDPESARVEHAWATEAAR